VKFFEERVKLRKKKKKKVEDLKLSKANIMASVQKGINRSWAWSACSRHFITEHLK